MYLLNSITESKRELPAFFLTASNRHNQENINYTNGMKSYQILAITEGTGSLEHNGTTYPLQKGCAFFTAPSIPVKYTRKNNLVSIYVTAKGSAINDICNTYAPGGFAFFNNVNLDKILNEINKIENEFLNEKRQSKLSILTYAFFLEFFESNAYDNENYLSKVINFIDKNFTQKITLRDIAKHCEVSVSKLCYDFKKKFNSTVFEYIINQRLNYARTHLLYASSIKVVDVALLCGFDDVSYFCKAYKNKFGVSPASDKII